MHHKNDPIPGNRLLLLIIILFSFVVSCKRTHHANVPVSTAEDADDFADQLEGMLKPVDTNHVKLIVSINDNVRYTYQLNDYQPVWFSQNGIDKSANTYLTELEDVRWDGLDPEHYNLSQLKKLRDQLKGDKKDIASEIALDTALTRSYLAVAHDLLIGTVLPKNADSLWYHANDSLWTAPRMLVHNTETYTSLNEYRSQVPTYNLLRDEYKRYAGLDTNAQLKAAIDKVKDMQGHPDENGTTAINTIIKTEVPWVETAPNDTISERAQLIQAYQEYEGIKPTGKIDSTTLHYLAMQPSERISGLKANMERIRWMQRTFGDLYVLVDVPLAELFLRQNGGNSMHMRVVVGKPIRQTPSIYATMANVVINPPWGVPPTILKKDVLPGITKSGEQYLKKKGLKAYDRKGNIISGSSINANNYKRYNYKQAPGDDNALGVVKFNLPNPWDIYLHDTPHRGDFVKRYRALSSGCVRLQQPQQMAVYILSEIEKKNFNQDMLDSLIQTHKTRWEILKTKIPVHIVYLTAFEDTTGNHMHFVSDVYQRDEKLISLLK